MKVVITAATVGEWMPAYLEIDPLYTSESHRLKLNFHQSGVGMMATAVSLTKLIAEEKPDLIIQAGIAGAFDLTTELGKIVVINEESLGDMGVEEEGKWKDIFELKLEKSSYHPFEKRRLPNPWLGEYNLLKLPVVNGVTVNEISTNTKRIEQLIRKYNPFVESMEGAALHYVCREANIPFTDQDRFNHIGERNKSNWQIKEAIDNLNQTLLKYIDKLYKIK